MKVKQIFLVIAFLAIFFPFQKILASTLTTDLISYWNLDEASGTRADSVSGNTLTPNVVINSVAGKVGSAVNFTGAGTYLNKTDNASLSTGSTDFTISMWVYLNTTTPQFILDKVQATNVGEWGVYYDGSNFRFVTYSSAGNYDVTASSAGSPVINTWYFITVTHDSVAHTNSIQINNGAVDTINGVTEHSDGTGGYLVGAYYTGAFYFKGYLDEMGFWKRKLTADEITNLYNSGNGNTYPFTTAIFNVSSTPSTTSAIITWTTNYAASSVVNYGTTDLYGSSTIESDTSPRVTSHSITLTGLSPCTVYHFQASSTDAYSSTATSSDSSFTTACVPSDNIISFWKFDEASGTRYDSLGVNNLTENSAMNSVSGKLGYGFDAASAGKYFKKTDNASLSTGGTDFTLSGWFNLNSETGVQVLMSKFQSGAAGEWALYYNSNTFVFTTFDAGSINLGYPATASMTINTNTWYFIVAKHDSVNHINTIQVNNGAVNTSVAAPEHLDSTAEFRVGEFAGANPALAKIDAVGFWKRLLGSAEVETLYNSGNGSEYPFNISDIISPSISSISSTKTNGTYTTGDTINIDVTFSESVTSTGSIVLTLETGDEDRTCSFTITNSSTATCDYTISAGDSSADLDVISVSGTIVDGVGNKLQNFTQGTTLAQNKDLVISTVNSISVSSPKSYQVFQRNDSNQANIIISGIYTGSPAAIEASWNGGNYTTIAENPVGGTFTGSIPNQTAGQGTLSVRFTDNIGTSSTINFVGIGDIYVVAGQSNAAGKGFNNQTYTPTNGLKAVEFGNDDNWKELVDPLDDGTNQIDSVSYDNVAGFPKGSVWPGLASYFLADQNVPIAFIPSAKDATAISQWLPGVDHSNTSTLYGSMYRRISAVGAVKAILFWQGESDVIGQMSSSTYKSNLDAFSQSVQDDFGVKVVAAQIGEFNGQSATYINNIREAQRFAWDQSGNVLPGPSLYDVNLQDESGDGLHFRSDEDIAVVSARWWAALKTNFYGGSDGRGPRLSSAEYNSAKTKIILTFTDESLPLFQTSTLTGFTVKNDGVPVLVSYASTTGSNEVTVFLSDPASGVLTISLGDGNSAIGAIVPLDNSTYNLPAEFFVDYVTTPLTESLPVTSTSVNNITTSSLQLNWVWGNGTELSYSVSSSLDNLSWQDVASGISTSTLIYSFNNGSLIPNTQYWFKVWSNGSETNTSTDFVSVHTSSSVPAALVASSVSTSSLILSWDANNNPDSTIYQISGDNDFATTTISTTTTNLTNLTPATIYTFIVSAQNVSDTSTYSDGISISTTTLSAALPTITTVEASSISTSTVTLNGNINSVGGATVDTRGFVYGTTTNYGATSTDNGSFDEGVYSADIISLSPATVYHFKAFSSNSNGTSYGSDVIFSTISIPTSDAPTTTITSANVVTTTISVPINVDSASVDLSSITADSSATLPSAISANVSMSLGAVEMLISSGTLITADALWDGTLVLPTIQANSSVTAVADSGYTATVAGVVEVGYGDVSLILNKAARILIPGMSGKFAGYYRDGVFTKITTNCSDDTQGVGDALDAGADCKINSGLDLVIWTKHFTKFAAYSQTQNVVVNSGGGGGGGGGGSSIIVPSLPVLPISSSTIQASSTVKENIAISINTAVPLLTITTPKFEFKKNLSSGMINTDVKQLQMVLKDLGYFTYPQFTTKFGASTRDAVKAFQKANGIKPVNGVFGPLTRSVLNKLSIISVESPVITTEPTLSIPVKFEFKKNLSSGMINTDVKQLQMVLKDLGYFTYPQFTTKFGVSTREAVKVFQKVNGIMPVSGVVGPMTRRVLNGLK